MKGTRIFALLALMLVLGSASILPARAEGGQCSIGKHNGVAFNTCNGQAIRCATKVTVDVTLADRGSVTGRARCEKVVATCTASAIVFAGDSCSDTRFVDFGTLECMAIVGSVLDLGVIWPQNYTVTCSTT